MIKALGASVLVSALACGAGSRVLAQPAPAAAQDELRRDVLANGARKLRALDVAAAAGAPLTEVTRALDVRATAGVLDLQFAPTKGDAIVSAITVHQHG